MNFDQLIREHGLLSLQVKPYVNNNSENKDAISKNTSNK